MASIEKIYIAYMLEVFLFFKIFLGVFLMTTVAEIINANQMILASLNSALTHIQNLDSTTVVLSNRLDAIQALITQIRNQGAFTQEDLDAIAAGVTAAQGVATSLDSSSATAEADVMADKDKADQIA